MLGVETPPPLIRRRGFEIYVDPTVDPDVGEIMIVKKKKYRIPLDAMSWGALTDTTNAPESHPATNENPALKVKNDEEKRWWTIGRGRKDWKEKVRSKAKENKISTTTQRNYISSILLRSVLNHLILAPQHTLETHYVTKMFVIFVFN